MQASNEIEKADGLIFSDVIENPDTFISFNQEYYLANRYYLESPESDLTDYNELPPVYNSIEEVTHDNVEIIESNLPLRIRCSCVLGARYYSGIDIGPIGYAKNHPVNLAYPAIGAIVVTYESWAGHEATIISIADDFSYFDVIETNFIRCAVTTRRIYTNNSKIKGYYWEYTINNKKMTEQTLTGI